ncbi:HlyU family transcriptional regulator [Sagittula sp. SSi028]|uniref:HlyU family transcriptional regulator n=1 Tax=Sagittula sp. SSi028 TaxID=3400636 RepID=UPI003AF80E42
MSEKKGFLARLFGGGAAEKPSDVVEHKGFRITPQPISEDGGFRISAKIEGEIDGETKTHSLIRADVIRDRDEAAKASVSKAQAMIDQMGAKLFDM